MSSERELSRREVLRISGGLTLIALAPAVAAAAGGSQTYLTLVFNEPMPGQDVEYNRWYNEEHLPDVVAVPGFVSAQRFRRSAVQLRADVPPSPQYLIAFSIVTDDLQGVYAEVRRRAQSGETKMSPTVKRGSGMNLTYLVTDTVGATPSPASPPPAPFAYQVVLADAQPGQEAELDEWYRAHHAAEIASFPGFTGYRLGTISPVQMMGTPPTGQHHLALFGMNATDLAKTAAVFQHPDRPMTHGPGAVNLFSVVYEAIGPLVSGDAVRAKRRK